MRMAVFGLGYVGAVSAACFADRGHSVLGMDVDASKVAQMGEGRSPIVETGLDELIAKGVAEGRLRTTTDPIQAVVETDVSLVCVGTPTGGHGLPDLAQLTRVAEQIGYGLKVKGGRHAVVVRSTVPPGTMRTLIRPTLASASGLVPDRDFLVATNPEFMRESSAVRDFAEPPKTVIGAESEDAFALVERIYEGLPGPMIRTSFEAAEAIKYVDNAWHALKVAFANEAGAIAKAYGIDSRGLMEIFKADQKLNISQVYLTPGFAFGGACLPKEVRAFAALARAREVSAPVLEGVMPSNEAHIQRAARLILAEDARDIAYLGFTFKAGTDDLRESPHVTLIEHLIGKGRRLRLYDPNVALARLRGANRAHLLSHLPHVEELMRASVREAVDGARVVVVGNREPQFARLAEMLGPEHSVIDLAGLSEVGGFTGSYTGIAW